jgi:transposase-like protein
VKWWRYPPTVKGIQVNHCKNPLCANFGIPPKPEAAKGRGRPPPGTVHALVEAGDYIVSASGKGQPKLVCELCGETIPMQSNLAVVEELMRLAAYLDPLTAPCCTNEGCPQRGLPVGSTDARYKRAGMSAAGTPRYQCLLCKATFSGQAKASSRQRVTHKNRDIFLLLVNKSPLKRISAVTGLSMVTLYRKLAFIHEQCLRFAGERERSLTERDLLLRPLLREVSAEKLSRGR